MPKYTVTALTAPEAAQPFCKFWVRNFPNWPAQKYEWFYMQNPCGPARCLMALETQSEELVGTLALFPRRLSLGDQKLNAAITGDFGVNENHRVLGPALALQRAGVALCLDGSPQLLYGFPNEISHPIQSRVGYGEMGRSTRLVRVLRSSRYVEKHIGIEAVARMLAKPVDAALRVTSRETFHQGRKDLSSGILEQPDERFNTLWSQSAAWRHETLIGDRSRSFLKWRFSDCPYRQFRFFVVESKVDRRLLGYIAYASVDHGVAIVDLLAADLEQSLEALLAGFLAEQRRAGCEMITLKFFGTESVITTLKRFNFVTRESAEPLLFRAGDAVSQVLAGISATHCFFTEADNDV